MTPARFRAPLLSVIAAAGITAAGLLIAAPALADSQKAGSEASGSGQGVLTDSNTTTMEERCTTLSEAFQAADPADSSPQTVQRAQNLHQQGEAACAEGDYADGINKIQHALREVGVTREVLEQEGQAN